MFKDKTLFKHFLYIKPRIRQHHISRFIGKFRANRRACLVCFSFYYTKHRTSCLFSSVPSVSHGAGFTTFVTFPTKPNVIIGFCIRTRDPMDLRHRFPSNRHNTTPMYYKTYILYSDILYSYKKATLIKMSLLHC